MFQSITDTNNYRCTCISIGIANDCTVNSNKHICQNFNISLYSTYMSGHRLATNGRICDGKFHRLL